MNNILIAVSKHGASKNATEWVSDFLSEHEFDGTVHIVYCDSEKKNVNGAVIDTQIPSLEQDSHCLQTAEEILDSKKIPFQTHIIDGVTPVEGIIDFINDNNIDLAITGHQSKKNSYDYVQSFAQTLIRNSPVPVTVVSS